VRLRAPTMPKPVEDVIGYTLLVLTAPAWLILAACIGSVWCKRKLIGPREEWCRWFAWYPVRVQWEVERDEWRWFEVVERRSWSMLGDTYYRPTSFAPTPSAFNEGAEG
jgi:hypothetical protein